MGEENNLPTIRLDMQMKHNPCSLLFIHCSLLIKLVHLTGALGKWSSVEIACWISHTSALPLLGTLAESSINLHIHHLPVINIDALYFHWKPSLTGDWLKCLPYRLLVLSFHSMHCSCLFLHLKLCQSKCHWGSLPQRLTKQFLTHLGPQGALAVSVSYDILRACSSLRYKHSEF